MLSSATEYSKHYVLIRCTKSTLKTPVRMLRDETSESRIFGNLKLANSLDRQNDCNKVVATQKPRSL